MIGIKVADQDDEVDKNRLFEAEGYIEPCSLDLSQLPSHDEDLIVQAVQCVKEELLIERRTRA